ncbi:hypothetical protein [Tardiphaga sp.]|uniref:hypothetical protein n=1 Tax=Tardiphaga sp. TaxID=1926292 RepID=UPI00262CC585|nr:hypothetical protein [Tardiphaga sp.]MDB5619161.1 hypothetical protein [Tardiphaga sp.]
MNITFTGRTALILATGLWIGVAGHVTQASAQNAEPAATTEASEAPAGKPIALKKYTRHHSSRKKDASSSHADKVKSARTKASEAVPSDTPTETASPAMLPASIANANAQLFPDSTLDPFTQAVPVPPGPLQADALLKSVGAEPRQDVIGPTDPAAKLVAADELNEIDRNADSDRPALTLASATIDPPVAATSADNSTWDKTSLIGKVFIAFGGLLTMASAARMFMA